MTELVRLLDQTDDELERALLGAVLAESPHPAALRDAALALGLAATTSAALVTAVPTAASAVGAPTTAGAVTVAVPTVVAPSVAATASVASLATLGKGLVGGALVSVLALTTVDQTIGWASKPGAASVSVTTATAQRGPSLPSPPRATTLAESPAFALAAPAPSAASAEVSSRRLAAPPPAEPSPTAPRAGLASATFEAEAPARSPVGTPPTDASLAAETRMLERARSALQSGDTGASRRALEQYRASKPSAVLSHEAALLEVRLLLATGQRAAAAAQARRVISLYPRIAHAESLRRLAAEP